MLLDANLNKIWDKTIGGTELDVPYVACPLDDSSIIIAGETLSGISGNKTTPLIGPSGWRDLWVVKLNPDVPLAFEDLKLKAETHNGATYLNWQSTFPDKGYYEVERTDAQEHPFVFIGKTEDKRFTDNVPMGGHNFYRVVQYLGGNERLYSNVVSAKHEERILHPIHLSGNELKITYPYSGKIDIGIYAVDGRQVAFFSPEPYSGDYTISLEGLAAGVYSCRLSSGPIFLTQHKFIFSK